MPSLTPMVKRLILINAVVFGALFVLFLGAESTAYGLQKGLGIAPDLWTSWFPFVPVWQLVTWGFVHSIQDPMHILFNMLFLFFLGTMLESVIGGRRLLVLYVSALLVAGLATLGLGLMLGETTPTVGASGAVLAIVVALAVLKPDTRLIFIVFPITLRTLAIFLVGMDVFYLLMQMKGVDGGNVARLAHVSGAAWGFLAARRGWIWRDPLASLGSWRRERVEQVDAEQETKLDELLAKIHREGIGSLTSREKAFLKQASKRRAQ